MTKKTVRLLKYGVLYFPNILGYPVSIGGGLQLLLCLNNRLVNTAWYMDNLFYID